MASKRVSVVVPCYNAERYLAEALGSIVSQSPPPLEVLVIDDGSADGSAAIAEGFSPHVRCVRQENLGISAARNRGLALARGELIAFLDADDVWLPGSLARRLALLDAAPEVEGVSGLVESFISPDLPPERRGSLACPTEPSAGRLAGTMLVRRAVFDRVGAFDPALRVGETIDWVARADAAGVRWRILDEVVLRRRIHGANTTARTPALGSEYLRVLKASLDRRRAAAPAAPPRA
ncbi:MAG TPA: glycosyltransferase [Gemmatimonadaceae bacterium]|nr:glycosyltransferase [Gemmatimonadaceae bacterium]